MKKVEFLIVGNGLAGTLLAFEMLKNKLEFRIVASSEIPRSSEVAAGMFNPLVFKRLTKSWLVDDLFPVMKSTYRKIELLLGQQFLFSKNILKPLSEEEKTLWIQRKAEPEFSKYILSVEDDGPEENLVPAAGYGIVNGSGYLDLKLFLNLADKYFRENGLLIPAVFDFDALNPAEKYFETENVQAAKIVFCEGVRLLENPFFRFVKIVPAKGEVLRIHAPGLSEKYILNKNVFALPVGNQCFKIGSTYDWNDLSVSPTEKGMQQIVEKFEKLVNVDYSILEHVAGIRPTISDRRPVLGAHPVFSNLFVFNGLGTKGVMLAPFFAKEMMNFLMSTDYCLNKEVDVKRFLK
ncbi:Glycine/D-amino acid oxidase [Mariniphaga anaerophila]|uniref:Glycine/D-amino acid oxidase n=1 Tax=Mariniphaga anaerophila TaxID=1484053 RepID=A0A1M4W8S5_9BACT|nr:FAD-dependent oxidoreductase [Mariniphaga anaerophila]SHE77661.1 Glycine/D-amino acid oxidase [Mariniphaga anaerophila]